MNTRKMLTTKLLIRVTFCFALVTCMGCEGFVRKFVRKPKKDKIPKVEMVLAPEEFHAPVFSTEELYRQYFIFWKSWQGELIESLTGPSINKKKQISCINEAIKNLQQLAAFFQEGKQKTVDQYLRKLESLREAIQDDIYGNAGQSQRRNAERISRSISKELAYQKVKDSLK